MTTPFAPRPLQPLPRYYGAVRPSPAHRYFRPCGWGRLGLFPWHRRLGSQLLTRAWLSFAPSTCRMSFLDGSLALASLNRACRDHRPDVSAALTTMAFDQSGPRWLGISDLIAEPEGPTFISYKVARCRLDRLRFVTQDPLRKSRNCATLTLCLFRAQKLTSFATRGLFRRILPVLSCSFGSGQLSG
jgi:hypothetical protein